MPRESPAETASRFRYEEGATCAAACSGTDDSSRRSAAKTEVVSWDASRGLLANPAGSLRRNGFACSSKPL